MDVDVTTAIWTDLFLENDEECEEDDTAVLVVVASCIALLPNPRPKIYGYVENVVPQFNEEQFRRLFRMSLNTFEILLSYLEECPELSKRGYGGKTPISVRKQLMITLWYLGGQDPIIRIADRFGVSESSIILSRNRIIIALINNVLPKVICWPRGQQMENVTSKFSERNNFPGIVGSLDDTHIKIRAPKDHPQSYINRKKFHSIHLQAICNADMEFMYCNIGFPGSCHDARVLRQSDFWDQGLVLCDGKHVIADGAYPLRRWLLTPYRDTGNLTNEQKNFNHLHSKNRVVIERAFGLLKGRFRRLLNLETVSVETAIHIINCCCVVHNICLFSLDRIDDFAEADENLHLNHSNLQLQEAENEGVVKRNSIARLLARH